MASNTSNSLTRTLGTFSIISYGIGDILGAGIYVLVGKVAGMVGPACWMSFLVAFFVACLTGLSYSELGARFPRSAGEAVFCLNAFRRPFLAYLVGVMVLLTGIVSMATISHGVSGYVQVIFPFVKPEVVMISFLAILTFINFWGMKESSITNIICTLVSLIGIFIVIAAGFKYLGHVDYTAITPPDGIAPSVAILQGATLAFYAFMGFEDIVNVADETKKPEKNIPVAILVALGVTAVIYILTAIAAVSAIPVADLAQSKAPLMLVVEQGFSGVPKELFTFIAICAVTNTALLNFVMSSRILYGMAREGLQPSIFARVHPKRKTPHYSIGFLSLVGILLGLLGGGLVRLAQATSLLIFSVFFLMNLSLLVLKLRSNVERLSFRVPLAVPLIGALSCLGLIFYINLQAYLTVLILVCVVIAMYGIQKLMRKRRA